MPPFCRLHQNPLCEQFCTVFTLELAQFRALTPRVEDQTMSRQVDFRVTGRRGATVLRFIPLSDAARTFVDANVALGPSQWHDGSFAVEDRFARDLADLLNGEGFDVSDGCATPEGN
jgi:hypothetical protein